METILEKKKRYGIENMMSSGKKSKSNLKYSLKGDQRSSLNFKDGSSEKKVKIQLEKNIYEMTEEYSITPEFLIAMVGVLYNIEKIEKLNLSMGELSEVEKSLVRPILHMIKIGKPHLKDVIYRHYEDLVERIKSTISSSELYRGSLGFGLIHFMDFIKKIDIYQKELESYTEIEKEKSKEEIERDALLMTSEKIRQIPDFFYRNFNDPDLRYALIETFKSLDILSWFRSLDLMDAIEELLLKKNDIKMQIYLGDYKGNNAFLHEKNFRSKFILYKELEFLMRDLEHHSGIVMGELLESEGIDADKFFNLLSEYNEPSLEEWKIEMKQLLQKYNPDF